MTTIAERLIGGIAAVVLLATVGADAATSDVADAVMRGDSAALRVLLAKKSDVNAPQPDGATALHWAVYREDSASVSTRVMPLPGHISPHTTTHCWSRSAPGVST